ncbi:RluA family pseudouridine synthase [bacterium]|nr:RluA family pseudouridine synthase [bacterium]
MNQTPASPSASKQADLSPSILFEDTHLLVVNKPAGLLSQGEKTGDENLVDWCRGHFGRNYVGLVHRLDRNTSGILVIGKRTKSANRLTTALQEGKIFRSYLGLVLGDFGNRTEIRWKHFLLKDENKNQTQVFREKKLGPPACKEALLQAQVLQSGSVDGNKISLLEIVLETGRSHQIRAQTAFEKHPILGDSKYGDSISARLAARTLLHSHKIRFPHPMTQEVLEFEAPIPEDMNQLIRKMKPFK